MPRSPQFRKEHNLAEVVGSLRRLKTISETGWHAIGAASLEGITLQNEFSEDEDSPPAWMISEDGFIRCMGAIVPPSSPTLPLVAWTFPVEARPINIQPFLLGVRGGGYANGYVDTNGDVVIEMITVTT